MIGGWIDNSSMGAVWVFIRSGGVWSQLGTKMLPTDESAGGGAEFGTSVALSTDGSTALIGGELDHNNGGNGAAWVYVRSGSTYVEQRKLDATGAGPGRRSVRRTAWRCRPTATQRSSAARTTRARVVAPTGGAAWVFSRNGTTWTQPGVQIVPTVAPVNNNTSNFRTAVALSSDGSMRSSAARATTPGMARSGCTHRSGATWAPAGAQPLTATGETGHSRPRGVDRPVGRRHDRDLRRAQRQQHDGRRGLDIHRLGVDVDPAGQARPH